MPSTAEKECNVTDEFLAWLDTDHPEVVNLVRELGIETIALRVVKEGKSVQRSIVIFSGIPSEYAGCFDKVHGSPWGCLLVDKEIPPGLRKKGRKK